MTPKALKWLIYTALFSVLPILILVPLDLAKKIPFDLYKYTLKGDFFLVSAVLSAGLLGEIFDNDYSNANAKLKFGGGCLVILFYSLMFYSNISEFADSKSIEEHFDKIAIFWQSIGMLFLTILSGYFILRPLKN